MNTWKYILLVLLAIVLGTAIAAFRIFSYENSSALFKNGNWMGTTDLPLGRDNLITAQVTLLAMYAFPSEEAVYLFAQRDVDGNLLHTANDYRISGNINLIKAKYWSITAYGKDLFLIPNEASRYSFNYSNIKTDTTGNFTIILSPTKHNGNWLPTPTNARFNLLLRIYKGEKEYLKELSTTPLPSITKMGIE
ncbi:MAG: DUF1214 domain-containing protein [Chitinophagales bacterium]|nr:DUF1214 domain-containing protein [Chitinophagales bacterium]